MRRTFTLVDKNKYKMGNFVFLKGAKKIGRQVFSWGVNDFLEYERSQLLAKRNFDRIITDSMKNNFWSFPDFEIFVLHRYCFFNFLLGPFYLLQWPFFSSFSNFTIFHTNFFWLFSLFFFFFLAFLVIFWYLIIYLSLSGWLISFLFIILIPIFSLFFLNKSFLRLPDYLAAPMVLKQSKLSKKLDLKKLFFFFYSTFYFVKILFYVKRTESDKRFQLFIQNNLIAKSETFSLEWQPKYVFCVDKMHTKTIKA